VSIDIRVQQRAQEASWARSLARVGTGRAQGFIVPLACLVVWEVVARAQIFPSYILPSFSAVLVTLWERLLTGELPAATFWSIVRVLGGFFIALGLAIPLGLVIGWSDRISKLFNPVFETLRPIPPMAWIPLSVIWLGIGMKSVLFICFLGAFFPILVNTIHGVRSVDRKIIEYSRSLGASTTEILFKVVIPSALPVSFVGMRIGLGVSWMTVVAAEMISVKYGLGYMIWKARYSFETDGVIAGMVAIGLLSIFMTNGMVRLEDRLFHWRKSIVKG